MSFFKKLLSPLLRTNVGEGRGGFGGATLPRTAPTREPTEYDEIADAEATQAEAEAAGILSGLDAEESRLMAGETFETPQSSNVAWFRYLKDNQELHVGFRDGSAYGYYGVDPTRATSILHSSSKGGAVWDYLRIRGTKLGHQVGYAYFSGPSGDNRKWNATAERAAAHGREANRQSSPFAKGGLGRKRGKRK